MVTRILSIIILFIITGVQLYAQPIIVFDENHQSQNISDKIWFRIAQNANDTSGILRLEGFKPNTNAQLNIDHNVGALWLAFAVDNLMHRDIFISLSDPTLQKVSFYCLEDDGSILCQENGLLVPVWDRTYEVNKILFKRGSKTNKKNIIWLKIEHNLDVNFSVHLNTLSTLLPSVRVESIHEGWFFGFMIAILLLNVALFTLLRERIYIFYVFYVLCNILSVTGLKGTFAEFVFPNNPEVNIYTVVFNGLGCICSLVFAYHFLPFKTNLIRIKGSLIIIGLLALTSSVCSLLGYAQLSISLFIPVAISCFLILSYTAFKLYLRGFTMAIYYIIAIFCNTIGSCLFVCSSFGLIDLGVPAEDALILGITMEALVFTLAMVQHLYLLKKDKTLSDDKLLLSLKANEQLILEQNKLLEDKVKERTATMERLLKDAQDSEIRYRLLAENSGEVIALHNIDFSLAYISPSLTGMVGYTVEEFMKFQRSDYVHPDDENNWNNIFRDFRNNGAAKVEFRFKRKDGDYTWIESLHKPVFDSDGRIKQIIATSRIIDVHKNSKQKEQEIRQFFESILDKMPMDISVFDTEKRYLYINSHAVKNPEIRSWLIGKNDLEYVHYRNRDESIAHQRMNSIQYVLDSGQSYSIEETLEQHGELKTYIRNINPVLDASNNVEMLICFGFDITRLKEVEQKLVEYTHELERSNTDLEHFAHIASHDFKAPLRVINSFLQLLAKRSANKFDDTDREYFKFVLNSVRQLSDLTDSLLAYSKIDKNIGEAQSVDLSQILDLAVLNLKNTIKERKADIVYQSLPTIKAHSPLLIQLFQNLIGNGIKYNKSSCPTVQISATESNEGITYCVADNGIGIQPEFKDSIFQMFRRLHTRDEFEGSGIGLALCKKVIDAYQGEIWVESEPNEGTRFYFTLPKAEQYGIVYS